MSTYKTFAVLGSGFFGDFVVSSLAAQNAQIIVLSRNPDTKKLPAGVKATPVKDYSDVSALTTVFKDNGIEVVVSTLGGAALASQTAIADAAKAAGVKLFVPSEFGSATKDAPEEYPILVQKDKIAKYSKSIGLPTALFFIGGFIKAVIPAFTGVAVNGKINVVGKGVAPISWTAEEDAAGFVAHVLTTLPPTELHDKIFRIQGDRKSLVDIATLYGKEIAYGDSVPGFPTFLNSLLIAMDNGLGSTGWDNVNKRELEGEDAAGSANQLWKGHVWKTIRDVHPTL